MRLATFAEIRELAHDFIVPSFVARIEKVYEQKSGEGQYGTWFLQNVVLSDGHDKLTMTWTGADAFDRGCIGDTMLFQSTQNRKGNWVGIKRDIRHVGDNVYEGVKVTEAAKISPAEPFLEHKETSTGGGERTTERRVSHLSGRDAQQLSHRRDDPPPVSSFEDRSHRIERQHSQEMAIRAIALTKQVLSRPLLLEWTDYFQRDIGRLPAESLKANPLPPEPQSNPADEEEIPF